MDNVCGLDIHKDSVFACILKTNGEKIQTQFGVTTPELDRLRDLLVEAGVSRVAMESTSVYWKPLWRILSMDFHMVLVNPYLIKQLPGRKTDVRDAEWIATLLAKELVRESFVPDETQSALRQYERRLHRLNRQIVHAESQMDNQMQACNIRLSNHVSDIGGKSYRKVVQALIEGETRPEELLKLIHGRTVNRCGSDTLIAALTGFVTGVDRDMLRFYMEECLLYERQREECLKSMEDICQEHYKEQKELLETIPGVSAQSAMCVLSEAGHDMATFPSASALVGWAGLRPRNQMSAGKIKGRKITHGNRFLRIVLVQCAWAAARCQGPGSPSSMRASNAGCPRRRRSWPSQGSCWSSYGTCWPRGKNTGETCMRPLARTSVRASAIDYPDYVYRPETDRDTNTGHLPTPVPLW